MLKWIIIFATVFLAACGSQREHIANNVYIHNVSVAGLTAQEAETILQDTFSTDHAVVRYMLDGEAVAQFTFQELGVTLGFGQSIEAALDKRPGLNRRNITHAPSINITPQRMESAMSAIARQVNKDATNPSFALENGQVTITPEVLGCKLDLEALRRDTNTQLATLIGGDIQLVATPVSPPFTQADFEFDLAPLGAFTTHYTGDDSRVFNVALAASKLNNYVLLPGEVFSAGAVIGANRANSGYKAAIVLVNGEPVEDIGGGVCQVVSTLYNAALKAEVPILQRHSHSAPVSYVDPGFDATVAGDYLDLKFKNHTQRPMLITTQMEKGRLTTTIMGMESRPTNREIKFEATRTETVAATYREIIDPTLPRGERVVTLSSQDGFTIVVKKHVWVDGVEAEVITIGSSTYKPLPGIVAIGAGG